jgi:2-polyprenyl-3-methyl-5-hydroxy-6-metoxy-1,4-benzoquinol methylase
MKSVKRATKQSPKDTKSSIFQSVPCPVCGSTSFIVVREGTFPDDLSEDSLKEVYRSSSDNVLFEQVVRCNKCQTVYLNPRLNPSMIIDSYAEGEDAAHVAQDPMRIRTFEKALKHLAKKYNIALSPETKVLDIGCAGGAFLLAAENLGLSTVGIEPNKWMSQFAQEKYQLDVRPGTLSDYHFADDSFDLVTLWDVIEHVPQPGAELREIHRILKPGGLLIVNYPDYSSLPARMLGKKWPFWLSVHLTYYTPKTIEKHLRKTGFQTQDIMPHWQTLELGYVLKRMSPYFALAKVPKTIVEKIGLGMMPITYWIGQTQVVARKTK